MRLLADLPSSYNFTERFRPGGIEVASVLIIFEAEKLCKYAEQIDWIKPQIVKFKGFLALARPLRCHKCDSK